MAAEKPKRQYQAHETIGDDGGAVYMRMVVGSVSATEAVFEAVVKVEGRMRRRR